MMPSNGLESATIAVEVATPRLHTELPVNVSPRKDAFSPRASLNRKTKYMGMIAATPLVAKAELAQSYMHQARMIRRWPTGRSPTVVVVVTGGSPLRDYHRHEHLCRAETGVVPDVQLAFGGPRWPAVQEHVGAQGHGDE